MNLQVPTILVEFEREYWLWVNSLKNSKELYYKFKDIDFKIFLNRGFLFCNSPNTVPGIFHHSVNISSQDSRIKDLFFNYLVELQAGVYHFSRDMMLRDPFSLHFFANQSLIDEEISRQNLQFNSKRVKWI